MGLVRSFLFSGLTTPGATELAYLHYPSWPSRILIIPERQQTPHATAMISAFENSCALCNGARESTMGNQRQIAEASGRLGCMFVYKHTLS